MSDHPAKIQRVGDVGSEMDGTVAHASTTDPQALINCLQCSLCLSMICEPISIPCGHSFCRACLVESLRRHKKQCPSCRAICHVSAETASENVMIKSLAMMLDSDGYQARLEEAAVYRATWSALYPIFFYNSVMFPGGVLSLHLFEPRYRHMMSRIVNTTQAFAYVPNFVNYQASNGDVALIAKLKDVSMLPDGRCFLEAVLSGRSVIEEHFVEDGTMGLHFCRVKPFNDNPIAPNDVATVAQMARQARILADYFSDQIGSKTAVEQRFGVPPTDAEGYSLWLSALVPLRDSEKLLLLRSQDTKARLERCLHALGAYVSRRNNPNSIVNATRSTVASALRGVMQVLMRTGEPNDSASEESQQDRANEEADDNSSGSSSEDGVHGDDGGGGAVPQSDGQVEDST